MLRILTANTFEIDSPDDAAAEVFEQVNPEENLLAHSVGILSCHPDFLYSGVVKAVCQKLPFPVVGATSTATATADSHGFDQLSLMVLTSDTVSFTTALTAPLTDDPTPKLHAAYHEALARAGGTPSLILAYAPLLPHFEGVRMVNEIDNVSGQVPLFGTIGVDTSNDFRDTHTIYNGEYYRDCAVLVLLKGDVAPQFHVIAVSESGTRKQKGVITDADGSILKSVNDQTCVDYMASIGLSPNDGLEGSTSVPFLVDYHDGSPPAGRAVYTFTPEGYAICGGEMPKNGSFTVAHLSSREITRTSRKLLESALEQCKPAGMLVISCCGRGLALGVEPYAEMEVVRELVGDVPMHMSYSGGEICPVYTDGGNTVNRFHNYTLTICMFQG